MSRLSERDIARKLAEREDLEPPAGLLDKIKNEIPPAVSVGSGAPDLERRSAMPTTQRWLIAASLVVAVGGGLFALRMQERMPMESMAAPEAAAEVPAVRDLEEAVEQTESGRAGASPTSPPPPAAMAAPKPAPREEAELQAVGYEAGQGLDQDVEDAIEVKAEAPLYDERGVSAGAVSGVEGRVEGGVAGGVPGGVVGGVVGGVQGGVAADSAASEPMAYEVRRQAASAPAPPPPPPPAPAADAPLRVGGEMAKQAAPGQPYAGVRYKAVGTNPFTSTAEDPLSTFGLDVDTASYTVARRYLSDGNLPDPRSVRVEEYVNYFHYGDPAPTRGDFAIRAEGAPSPFAPGANYRLLRFNIRGREVKAESRRPVVLTFVIDVSGSMDMENRLGLVKQSLGLLLDQLKPNDEVGLVVYGGEARLVLEPTNDREAIRQAIDSLRPEGSTNAEAGLVLGYDVAGRNFRMNANNRIILCSDGVANVGHAGPQAILGRIGREARRGIELTTLGFGMGNYNDHLMEQLANKGDGRYAYIDDIKEARRVLVEEVTGTLQTIAKDAKVQVELNPAVVSRYRLVGYENRAIADERFRDNTVDAGEVGAGHSVTALYEVELKPGAPRDAVVATLRLRYQVPVVGNITETERQLRVSQLAASWEGASPGLRLASLVAEMAEIFKQTSETGDLGDVARRLRAVVRELPRSEKLAEVVEVAEKAARVQGRGGREVPEED